VQPTITNKAIKESFIYQPLLAGVGIAEVPKGEVPKGEVPKGEVPKREGEG
jgi:hypothetical protein